MVLFQSCSQLMQEGNHDIQREISIPCQEIKTCSGPTIKSPLSSLFIVKEKEDTQY